jgi:DNA helicase IV
MRLLDIQWPEYLVMDENGENEKYALDLVDYFVHVDFVGSGPNNEQIRNELRTEEAKQARKKEVREQKEAEEQARRAERERLARERKRIAQEEAERQERIRKELEDRLITKLQTDYLGAAEFYKNELYNDGLATSDYGEIKTKFLQNWVTEKRGEKTDAEDLEQAAAIGSVDYHTLVSARAGSGKTATLINRALFLNDHCNVGGNEILMLAFNRDAAQEMRDRLEEASGSSYPHVMTFHALAYALVHPEKSILFDEPEGAQQKSSVLQSIVDEYIHSAEQSPLVRKIMLSYFRQDWEKIVQGGYDKVPAEMIVHRRSLPNEALDGKYYKSQKEKEIANFFIEHGISFKYERNFWWKGINYRPDFTIFTGENKGVVIEYFGMAGDPDYDEMTKQKIDYWQGKKDWKLIEVYPSNLQYFDISQTQQYLRDLMTANEIAYSQLSDEEVWLKVKDRAIDHLTRVIVNFIQRSRKLSLSAEDLKERVSQHQSANDEEDDFLQLVSKIYKSYLIRVEETGEDDFDGLLQKASRLVEEGKTSFERKSGNGDFTALKFIMIDEYQDFSALFFKLVSAIKRHAPNANLFCVGDDWQAINGFAGSDLNYFSNFKSDHKPSRKLEITTNYRSLKSIVKIGNRLMDGLGTPAKSHSEKSGSLTLVDMSDFQPLPREQDFFSGDDLTPVILRLVQKIFSKGHNVVLLTRKNTLPWYVNAGGNNLEKFLTYIRGYLDKSDRRRVSISTTHKYKGLQKSSVIILDAVERCYPLIHPDIIFNRVFGDGPQKAIEEDRRLFYVALTRAVNSLYVITQESTKSPFLSDIESGLKKIDWNQYPPPSAHNQDGRIFVLVGNSPSKGSDPTHSIHHILKAEGFRWSTSDWPCWYKSFPVEEVDPSNFVNSTQWISDANGLELRFQDSSDNLIAKCHIVFGSAVWEKGSE